MLVSCLCGRIMFIYNTIILGGVNSFCGFVSCPCMLVSRFPLLKANLITIECWNVAVCISYRFVYKHSYLVSYQEIYQIFCVPQIIAAVAN